jgi:serine/threonine protein kinase
LERIAGKYDIVRELGKGSYGSVYLVRHAILGTPYALKVLNTSTFEAARLVERFKQEAEILERFTHPGLVHLRDFGVADDGRYYMTMDYCEGRSLEEFIVERRGVDVPMALDIIEQVLCALDAAHNSGIIHRDIKPDNLIVQVGANGRATIKILDFGVAKLRERLLLDGGTTSEGVAIGTPFYMSPEQAAGERLLDNRSDLYSVGVMLYRLLTEELPFQGETVIQTLLMHITKPVDRFAERLGLPIFFDDMLFRALAKDRVHRYQDAAEFLHDLVEARRLLFTEGQHPPSAEHEQEQAEVEMIAPAAVIAEPTRILCLDDNEMILQILRYILEGQGYEVFTATDFSVIHSYLFREKAKLMLCDVNMPGVLGTRVCQMLKESISDLKIVLFSNIPDRELEKLAQESRADDWLSKNTRPEDWLEKINSILGSLP